MFEAQQSVDHSAVVNFEQKVSPFRDRIISDINNIRKVKSHEEAFAVSKLVAQIDDLYDTIELIN
jgi:hypothetical protein